MDSLYRDIKQLEAIICNNGEEYEDIYGENVYTEYPEEALEVLRALLDNLKFFYISYPNVKKFLNNDINIVEMCSSINKFNKGYEDGH